MPRTAALILAVLSLLPLAAAQDKGVEGTWREPGGSVIRVGPCGQNVCATLVAISKQAPSQFDEHNPAGSLRSRRLCGLQIGTGFHLNDPDHASDGRLYDPKTGKTYHGEMTGEGDTLHLRGYVGIKAFGRTEDWTRVTGFKDSCE